MERANGLRVRPRSRRTPATMLTGALLVCLAAAGCTFGGPAPGTEPTAVFPRAAEDQDETGGAPSAVFGTSEYARGVPGLGAASVFTVVETGVVSVERRTSLIVWDGWDSEHRVIGSHPWRTGRGEFLGTGSVPFGQHRDIVGNPAHDLVSWVEGGLSTRGDIVVVRASTGEELARSALAAAADFSVLIASVDDESVHFAALPTEAPEASVSSDDIWVWDWAAGADPELSTRGDRAVADVSSGIWAVQAGGGLQFEDEAGNVFSELPSTYGDRTFFGGALSPDGNLWYGPAHSEVVVVATGRHVPIDGAFDYGYGWTGTAELTLLGSPDLVCDALTGSCHETELVDPAADGCTAACGRWLPVN